MKNTLTRILCSLLALLLVLPLLASCGGKKTDATTAETVADTTAAVTEDPGPTDPLDVGDVIARLGEKSFVKLGRTDLTFDLTHEEIDAMLADIDRLDEMITAGTDYDAFDELYTLVTEDKLERLAGQDQLIYILWSCNLKDPLTEAAYLYVDELYSDIIARLNRMYQPIYDSPFRDQFYDDWTEEEIAIALRNAAGYTDEMTALNTANNDLLVAFRALDDSDESFGLESARLFLDMAKNNQRIAALLQFDNYMEYAYSDIYSRDYTPADSATFRDLFADGLMDQLAAAVEGYMENGMLYSTLNDKQFNVLYDLLYGDIQTDHFDLVKNYAATVGETAPKFLETFNDFWETKNYFFTSSQANSYAGAFTTYLYDSKTPVIYFGPDYHSPDTFLHEFGHYDSAVVAEGMDSISYDLAETQSQSDEFLFTYWLGLSTQTTTNQKVARALAEYKIYELMSTILTASLVNDFENYVYTHLDEVTPEGLDDVLISLCDAYGGYDAVKTVLGYNPEIYWHYVVMESPGYYISYAMSAVPVLEVYALAQSEGLVTAIEAYEKIINADPEEGFLAALEGAGINSPFEAETYAALSLLLPEVVETTEEPAAE